MDYTPNNSMDRLESIAMELRRVYETLATIGQGNASGAPPKTPEEEKIERAWVASARVLDRLFLVLYLIGNFTSIPLVVFRVIQMEPPSLILIYFAILANRGQWKT